MKTKRIYVIPLLVSVCIAASTVLADPAAGKGAENGKSAASDRGNSCDNKNLNQIEKLLNCVNAEDAMLHLEALQMIADANGGTRASGTPGYDASADYVASLLENAGYNVERQVFSYPIYTENSSSLIADSVALDTQTMEYSGSGTVIDGNVIDVDLDLGLGNSSTSGCEVADFDGLDWSGSSDIALIQRGACAFGTKATNAVGAGAEAVIIFNQGNTENRLGIIGGTLGEGVVGIVTIPVLDVSYNDGLTVLAAASVSASADATTTQTTTENIVADLPGVNTDNVVMAGAHLDSVPAGPGINDNGSGSAALLTVALQLGNNKKYTPQNTLRFAWWGAEEAGLIGSTEYIFNPDFGITQEEYDALSSYLNFDMVSSPNFIYGVYDADESTFPAPVFVPPGSEALENLFEAFYTIQGIPYEDSAFSGRSDYQAFINVGIPAGGLFTGAEGIKTVEQEAIWGGVASNPYDPCYHLACDTLANVSTEALEINIDAIAYAIFNLAASTEAVNGVEGVNVKGTGPDQVIPDGPQGTFLGSGGLDDGSFSK